MGDESELFVTGHRHDNIKDAEDIFIRGPQSPIYKSGLLLSYLDTSVQQTLNDKKMIALSNILV